MSIFTDISKYKIEKDRSSTENFCTELFVGLINKFGSKSEFRKIIKDLFGKDFIEITTQSTFQTKYNISARPDIVIYNDDDSLSIVEVKVDSGLNYYKIGNKKKINQIELYQGIVNELPFEVYSLTKRELIDSGLTSNKRKRWIQIKKWIEKTNFSSKIEEDYLTEFIEYLEFIGVFNMELKGDINSSMQNISNLVQILSRNIEQLKESKGFSSRIDFNTSWVGFKLNNDKMKIWYGFFWGENNLKIVIEDDPSKRKIVKLNNKIFVDDSDWVRAELELNQNILNLKDDAQYDYIYNWSLKVVEIIEN